MTERIIHGDCLDVMRAMDADSIDATITDPPYELGFMGKTWDRGGIAFRVELWEAALRVAKPGTYLLAFGGTRTYHRMTCAIEDAGWEIHDCLTWLYGSGFPKHKSKLKPAWEPIVMARKPAPRATMLNIDACRLESGADYHDLQVTQGVNSNGSGYKVAKEMRTFAPAQGRWPANVCCDEEAAAAIDAQSGERGSSLTHNYDGQDRSLGGNGIYGRGHSPDATVTTYNDTGGASRFYFVAKPTADDYVSSTPNGMEQCGSVNGEGMSSSAGENREAERSTRSRSMCRCGSTQTALSLTDTSSITETRTPETTDCPTSNSLAESNIQCATPATSGNGAEYGSGDAVCATCGKPLASTSHGQADASGIVSHVQPSAIANGENATESTTPRICVPIDYAIDSPRFLYTPKASRSEREAGLEGFDVKASDTRSEAGQGLYADGGGAIRPARNHHPTVKPVALMRWLVRLVTPPGGTVLDPFAGSGTTGMAAVHEDRSFIGIENEKDYVPITDARIRHVADQGSLFRPVE